MRRVYILIKNLNLADLYIIIIIIFNIRNLLKNYLKIKFSSF